MVTLSPQPVARALTEPTLLFPPPLSSEGTFFCFGYYQSLIALLHCCQNVATVVGGPRWLKCGVWWSALCTPVNDSRLIGRFTTVARLVHVYWEKEERSVSDGARCIADAVVFYPTFGICLHYYCRCVAHLNINLTRTFFSFVSLLQLIRVPVALRSIG